MYINLDNDLGDYDNVGYRSYDYDYNQQLPATQQQQQPEGYYYNQQLPATQQQQQQQLEDYDYNQQLPANQQQQQQQLEDYDYNQQLPANQQQQQQLDDYDYPEEPLAVPNSQISDIQRPPLSRHESQVNIISNFILLKLKDSLI